MSAFVSMLVGALGWMLKGLVARVIVILGLTAVTYVGVGAAILELKDVFIAEWNAVPAVVRGIVSMFRIDQAVLLIFSAMVGRVSFNTINDSFTRIITQPGTGGGGG